VEEVIAALGLEPHPEGGYFREIFRADAPDGGRAAMTSIYYMPPVGRPSRWRVIDADEVWSFHAGAPLMLSVCRDGQTVETHRLGTDYAAGEVAQAIVSKGAWARAESHGGWSLVGGTCVPGFVYEGFRMAPPGWQPGDLLP
jgi:uncharacterized protein